MRLQPQKYATACYLSFWPRLSALSDHYPLFFHFHAQFASVTTQFSHTHANVHVRRIDWSKITSENYLARVYAGLSEFLVDTLQCCDPLLSLFSATEELCASCGFHLALLLAFPVIPPLHIILLVGITVQTDSKRPLYSGREFGMKLATLVHVFCLKSNSSKKRFKY